jgi:hypothetical protein
LPEILAYIKAVCFKRNFFNKYRAMLPISKIHSPPKENHGKDDTKAGGGEYA